MNTMKKSIIAFAIVLCNAVCPQVVNAQIGITGGTEYGIGGIVRAGSHQTTAEFGGGIVPFFFYLTVIGGNDVAKLYFPLSAGAKLSFALTDEKDPHRAGLKLGASYNSLIGIGFGGGLDYKISKKDPVFVAACMMVYPSAKQLLVDRLNEDDGSHYKESEVEMPLAGFQIVVSVSYLFGH